MRWALGVEYDGSAYAGWQQQPGARSVQSVLDRALSAVADGPVHAVCAGRTDRGVHATGQVVHFDSAALRRPRAWVLGANSALPPDANILWAREVPDSFHARFSAIARSYRYVILNRPVRSGLLRDRSYWVHRPLDETRMRAAAAALEGEHDFSAFRAASCQAGHAVREIRRVGVTRQGPLVLVDITANAFLQRMVRNIAGALVRVGTGEEAPQWIAALLEGRDRRLAGPTAPAAGLYLREVRYPAAYGLPAAGTQPACPPPAGA
ncbi:MAG TPA: tRNA pseudouridine(38-40) synthase TruA [Gammaproteobacteria bacterium]|nr:tRNA pseudouridine(38-40) synthase TruA [Gammaproteobacteria bacterium]